ALPERRPGPVGRGLVQGRRRAGPRSRQFRHRERFRLADATRAMPDTLTITDNRTGKSYEVPVTDGFIKATDLKQIKTAGDDQGLATYDPAFMNTASCRSKITYIDGDKGVLEYRGYPIEQLAERSTF